MVIRDSKSATRSSIVALGSLYVAFAAACLRTKSRVVAEAGSSDPARRAASSERNFILKSLGQYVYLVGGLQRYIVGTIAAFILW